MPGLVVTLSPKEEMGIQVQKSLQARTPQPLPVATPARIPPEESRSAQPRYKPILTVSVLTHRNSFQVVLSIWPQDDQPEEPKLLREGP